MRVVLFDLDGYPTRYGRRWFGQSGYRLRLLLRADRGVSRNASVSLVLIELGRLCMCVKLILFLGVGLGLVDRSWAELGVVLLVK